MSDDENIISETENAIQKTMDEPNIEQYIADLKIAFKLFMKFKSDICALHPSIMDFIKFLL